MKKAMTEASSSASGTQSVTISGDTRISSNSVISVAVCSFNSSDVPKPRRLRQKRLRRPSIWRETRRQEREEMKIDKEKQKKERESSRAKLPSSKSERAKW